MTIDNPLDPAMSNLKPGDKVYRCFNGPLEEAIFRAYIPNAHNSGRGMSCTRPKTRENWAKPAERFTCSIDMYFSTPEKAIEHFLADEPGYIASFNRHVVEIMEEHNRVLRTFDDARTQLEQIKQDRMKQAADAMPPLSEIMAR